MQNRPNQLVNTDIPIIALHIPTFDGSGDLIFSCKVLADLQNELPKFANSIGQFKLLLVVDSASTAGQVSALDKLADLDASHAYHLEAVTDDQFRALLANGTKLALFMTMVGLIPLLFTLNPSANKSEATDIKTLTEEFFAKCKDDLDNIKTGIQNYMLHLCQTYSVPQKTPIIILPEYSIAPPDLELALPDYPKISMLSSGLGRHELGILISDHLITTKREEHWISLNILAPLLLRGKSVAHYHETHQVYYEYSRDECADFLMMHSVYCKDSKQHQDIVSLGGIMKEKLLALIKLVPQLLQDGFKKIIFDDRENNLTFVIRDSNKPGEEPGKTYTLIHFKRLPHLESIALMGICEDLVGITGDQSLSEAISKKVYFRYERGTWHKRGLAQAVVNYFYFQCKDKTYKEELKELLELLILKPDLNDKDYSRLGELFQQKTLLEIYKHICDQIANQHRLSDRILSKVVISCGKNEINFNNTVPILTNNNIHFFSTKSNNNEYIPIYRAISKHTY